MKHLTKATAFAHSGKFYCKATTESGRGIQLARDPADRRVEPRPRARAPFRCPRCGSGFFDPEALGMPWACPHDGATLIFNIPKSELCE